MFVFAHLRKCAGTSVIRAAERAGMRLPHGHVNGHLPDANGDALPGIGRMSFGELDRLLRPLVLDGIELLAIEWEFPRFERFPDNLGLRFFTILRDPLERLVSNFVFDVVECRLDIPTIGDYLERTDIWTRGNYYTRFFCGLSARQPVRPTHVDYAFEVVSRHFAYAFMDSDLDTFLKQEVGLPIRRLPRSNRTGTIGRLLNRRHVEVSPVERERLRDLNGFDYALCDRLRSFRATRR